MTHEGAGQDMKVFKGKIWAAIGSIMDHASTKSSSTSSVPDRALLAAIEAAIERCTGGGDDDRHVHEILFLVSNSPGAITFLSRRITARLEAARAPTAALRPMLLVHRLLRAGDRYFEQDLRGLWASRDLRVDAPRCSCSSTFTGAGAARADTGACAFVHGYSVYLEERMQWVINQAGNLEPARRRAHQHHHNSGGLTPPPSSSSSSSSSDHNATTEVLLFKLAMCQRLLDLAIQLLPDNNTSGSAAALSAFGIVLRESFKVYDAFTEGLDAMLLRAGSLAGLSKPMRVSAHEILRKASTQTPELKEFYHKCKRSSSASKGLEYPLVRIVTQAQASAMMEPVQEADGLEEAESSDGGHADPFTSKMEATISTVWVEFDDDDGQHVTGDR
ncbi:hypothetical protein QOZ80_9AG0679790 [Eleusine coracana subsp. coracana]|nr:hypothetical protein QOZ80_9AG0679790 [Eleusine coracana subsp. coracana]